MKYSGYGNTMIIALLAYVIYTQIGGVTWYEITTAVKGVSGLLNMPKKDIDACIEAYKFLQNVSKDRNSDTEVETENVRAYYAVLNEILAVVSIEKMYIPPQLDPKASLFQNQLLHERLIFKNLGVKGPGKRILDVGCGRGKISHHFAEWSEGSSVSGFNIDANQIKHAIQHAKDNKMDHLLDFKIGDHHKRFDYPDNTFDGMYSFQAVWPFFKPHELDFTAKEMFRVLKPGARYSCGEYLLAPAFDWKDQEHFDLHKLFLPTLAATQSNYPKDITDAFKRAGFKIIKSAPSRAPTWPLTDQKTDLFLAFRKLVIGLTYIGVTPEWVEVLVNNLLLGGQAWAAAEKMKIADLNWEITVEKPST